MSKLLGILPYLYFDEPVRLGNLTFLSVPDFKGRDHSPNNKIDKQRLQELSKCFQVTRGLSTSKGAVRAITYFIRKSKKGYENKSLETINKSITLLRYSILRPDNQALDNTESTYMYVFSLPPSGKRDYKVYQSWPNFNIEQEVWITPQNFKFPLPGWHTDFQSIHSSQLEDISEINKQFYGHKKISKDKKTVLALEWYNQSFLKYSLHNVTGRLVDIATAFETLFQLPRHNKTDEFRKRIREYLGVKENSILDIWAKDFYSNVRSETVHKGKPVSYQFKHPEADVPHLSFLWTAQRVFRECLSAKTGLPRHIDNNRLTDELTPNEVHLKNLREAGSFEKILRDNLLGEIESLRRIYPVGKREDIVWLGKILLSEYDKKYKHQDLPTLKEIIKSADTDFLGWLYHRFRDEFKHIYPDSYITIGSGEMDVRTLMRMKPITRFNSNQVQLESTIFHFIEFAAYALTFPTKTK